MPRTARRAGESRLYHVATRGNNRKDIYLDDGDRLAFLLLLVATVRANRWTLHTYCLMRNHYHLLLEAELDDLSTGMRVLNGSYAKTFNKRHGRTGHLFGERFWCETIEREGHLLECIRYIANNPVRAGFCSEPASWPWGSYRALAGLDHPPTFLAADATLSLFGAEPHRSRQRFRAFVAER